MKKSYGEGPFLCVSPYALVIKGCVLSSDSDWVYSLRPPFLTPMSDVPSLPGDLYPPNLFGLSHQPPPTDLPQPWSLPCPHITMRAHAHFSLSTMWRCVPLHYSPPPSIRPLQTYSNCHRETL